MRLVESLVMGNSAAQWGLALLSGGGTLAALRLLQRMVVVRLAAVAERTANRIDDLAVELLRGTGRFFLAIIALWVAVAGLSLPSTVHQALHGVTVLGFVLQAAIWGNAALAQVLGARVVKLRSDDPATATTLNGLMLVSRIALGGVALLLALDNLGVNVSTLVAGLGIGGVAIALATQNILGDLFASLSIVLDRPFVVGDFIVVDDLMGSVEHVGLKTTRVRSLSGEQLVFANADLLGSRIRNFKRMAERRVVFTLGVVYQTRAATLERIPPLIREIIETEPGVRFDRAHFKSFDDCALTFEIVYYVLDPDYNRYMDVQQRVNLAIYRRFKRAGIDFAFPTRTVYVTQPEPTPLAPIGGAGVGS